MFKNTIRKDEVFFPKIDDNAGLRYLYKAYVILPLLLIKNLEPDLLLPFSYLILQTLEKIDDFNKSYVSTTSKDKFTELLFTCGSIIDEIKENCLSLYLNGLEIEDSLISEANKQAQILNEAAQLKMITSSFFNDFNRYEKYEYSMDSSQENRFKKIRTQKNRFKKIRILNIKKIFDKLIDIFFSPYFDFYFLIILFFSLSLFFLLV